MQKILKRWVVFAGVALLLMVGVDDARAQQETLRGRVLSESGMPVAGAEVVAVEESTRSTHSTLTSESGTFELELRAGRYAVQVRSIGYEGAEQIVEVDGDATLAFELVAAPITFDGVEVVGVMRTLVPAEAMPGAITVVTREQIDAQAELTPRLGEILTQLVPGLSATTQSMSNYGQTFRGRNAIVLIDGVPQSTSRNGMRDFLTIDPAMVERVEVLRGATAIYGEGATGGVINIVTRRGAATGIDFTTDVSTQSSLSSTGDGLSGRIAQTISGGRNALDFLVSGAYGVTGGFFDGEGDRIPSDPHGQGGVADMTTADVLAKVGYERGSQRLQLATNYYRAVQETEYTGDPSVDADGSDATKARVITGLDLEDDVGSENLLLNLDYTHVAVPGGRAHAQAYFRDYLTRFAPYDGRPFASLGNAIIQSRIDSRKFGGRIEHDARLFGESAPTLLWGLDYNDETTSQPVGIMDGEIYDESNGLVFRKTGERPWVPEVNTRSLGLFAQLAWSPFERLVLRGGVRHERATVEVDDFTTIQGGSATGGELSYEPVLFNAGAVVDIVDGASVYGSFSQGFSLADIGRLLRGVPDGFELGSEGFDAQKVDQYEVGARAQSRRVRASLSGFRNVSELGSTFDAELEIVRAPERVYGIEATLDVMPVDALTLGGTYTWTEGENRPGDEGEWIPLDGYRIQPSKLTAYVEHATRPWWRNRIQALHSGERDRLFEEDPEAYGGARVESYTVVDVLSTLDVGPGALSVGIENVLNEQYFPVVSQLEAMYGNFYRAAARGATLTLGYSLNY